MSPPAATGDDPAGEEPSHHGDRGDSVGGRRGDGSGAAGPTAGLLARFRLTWLTRRYPERAVTGAFAFVNGLVTIAILAAIAMVSDTPSLFPSLGPTAFLLFSTPLLPSASPRNSVIGHLIGALSGYVSLVVFGLTDNEATIIEGVTAGRVGAAALSLALTSGIMVWLNRAHPPAGATTMIVSLGIIPTPSEIAVLMLAVVLLVAQGYVINRMAGIDYPLWSPRH